MSASTDQKVRELINQAGIFWALGKDEEAATLITQAIAAETAVLRDALQGFVTFHSGHVLPTGLQETMKEAQSILSATDSPGAKAEDTASADSYAALFQEIGEWAVATFPQATPESWCKHLQKEVAELAAKPSDLEEMADCMILLAGLVHKQSYTPEDLRQAIHEKLEINKKRVWGQPDKDGVVEHVRE